MLNKILLSFCFLLSFMSLNIRLDLVVSRMFYHIFGILARHFESL